MVSTRSQVSLRNKNTTNRNILRYPVIEQKLYDEMESDKASLVSDGTTSPNPRAKAVQNESIHPRKPQCSAQNRLETLINKLKAELEYSKMDVDMDEVPEQDREEIMDCSEEQNAREKEQWTVEKHYTNYELGLKPLKSYTYFVIDTCVYVHSLDLVQKYFEISPGMDEPCGIIVLPYKVLQELEGLKSRPTVERDVSRVLHFILNHAHLGKYVKQQDPRDDLWRLFDVLSSDDAILNCALQVQTTINDQSRVVLISQDVNLLTKAAAAKLYYTNIQDFPALLRNFNPTSS